MSQIIAYQGIDNKVLDSKYGVAVVTNEKGNLSTVIYDKKNNVNKDAVISTMPLRQDSKLAVSMPFVGVGKKNANSEGWLRDSNYYFRQLQKQCPEAISEKNAALIQSRQSIVVDKQFSNHFPQFDAFQGQNLYHHHIGKGPQAVAIPESMHVSNQGIHVVENITGITKNAKEQSKHLRDSIQSDPLKSIEQIVSEFQQQKEAGFRESMSREKTTSIECKKSFNKSMESQSNVMRTNQSKFSSSIMSQSKEGSGRASIAAMEGSGKMASSISQAANTSGQAAQGHGSSGKGQSGTGGHGR